MFNLGLFEISLFGIIALIVLGPDKLPQAARTLGKWYVRLVHAKDRLKYDIIDELGLAETQRQLQQELAELRRTKADFQAQIEQLQSNLNQGYQHLEQQVLTPTPSPSSVPTTTPMNNRFFLLGDYDKARRLPPAPFLPNTQADTLLYQYTQPTP